MPFNLEEVNSEVSVFISIRQILWWRWFVQRWFQTSYWGSLVRSHQRELLFFKTVIQHLLLSREICLFKKKMKMVLVVLPLRKLCLDQVGYFGSRRYSGSCRDVQGLLAPAWWKQRKRRVGTRQNCSGKLQHHCSWRWQEKLPRGGTKHSFLNLGLEVRLALRGHSW